MYPESVVNQSPVNRTKGSFATSPIRNMFGFGLARIYLQGDTSSLLANLGWVDFDFYLFHPLPGLMGNWQNWLSSWARWWKIPNQSQLNPGSPGDVSPCISPPLLLQPTSPSRRGSKPKIIQPSLTFGLRLGAAVAAHAHPGTNCIRIGLPGKLILS